MKDRKHAGWRGLARVLFFMLFSFIISGCSLSADSVELHTKEEMQKIVEERYGEAELIGVEDVQESERSQKKRIFTYRDKKYGFTYQVISQPNSVGMDGSTFYYDGASVRFQYEEPFMAYFMEQEKDAFAEQGIELCDTLSLSSNYSTDRKFSLKSKMLLSTGSKWEEDMQFAWDRVRAYGNLPETAWNDKIDVYDSEKIAFCGTLTEEGFVTAEAQRIDYYMEQAEMLGGICDIEYQRTERKRVSEVPGLSGQQFYQQEILDNDRKVNVYYFTYGGKEYFIVDVWVAQKLEEEGISPIFQYYQNYKHYDVSGD